MYKRQIFKITYLIMLLNSVVQKNPFRPNAIVIKIVMNINVIV
ncbi:hypothetical protein JMUB7545_27420 [Staphylococcus aureus]